MAKKLSQLIALIFLSCSLTSAYEDDPVNARRLIGKVKNERLDSAVTLLGQTVEVAEISNFPSGDNLGSAISSSVLNMGNFGITNSTGIQVSTGGSVQASTYTYSSGYSIFSSSSGWGRSNLNGFTLFFGSGTITASSSQTIVLPGVPSMIGIGCFEIWDGNTSTVSIRMNQQVNTDRFICYNGDPSNDKSYGWLAFGRP